MKADSAQRSVLLIGKSQLVLDESVAGLCELGYEAEGTNDFTDITRRFDVQEIDLVVFGGQVPPDRKAELREEIGAINPRIIFVQGLAGGHSGPDHQPGARRVHCQPTRPQASTDVRA
jgi:hypothetical protein